jgi:Uma2 family endonuclease
LTEEPTMATDISIRESEQGAAPPCHDEADTAPGIVLRGVPWDLYVRLRDLEENYYTRMTYLDGTLILMSPASPHESGIQLLSHIIWDVAEALEINIESIGMTTLRRKGPGPKKGSGKEPDNAFYVGANEALVRNKLAKDDIDLEVDPPPDLALEVDNTSNSKPGLRVYARIGVPEVWRYKRRKRTLWFGRLSGGVYETIDRSLCLPMLTPALVLEALDARAVDGVSTRTWKIWLRDWARALPQPPKP